MEQNEAGSPASLRVVALLVLLAGAAGSVAFMLRAGQRTPTFLLITMVVWVLAPLATLAWSTAVSRRWSIPVRWTLCGLSLALPAASVAIYGNTFDVAPKGSANAFRFVMMPAVSWLVIAAAIATAAVIARKGSGR